MRLRHMILASGLAALAGCASATAPGVNSAEMLPPAGLHPLNTPPPGNVQTAAPPQPVGAVDPTRLDVALVPVARLSPVSAPVTLRPVAEPPPLHGSPPVALMTLPLPQFGNHPSASLSAPSPMPTLSQPASTVPPSAFWQTMRN